MDVEIVDMCVLCKMFGENVVECLGRVQNLPEHIPGNRDRGREVFFQTENRKGRCFI